MGEYVRISSSPTDIINIAHRLKDRGETLAKAVKDRIPEIEERENRGGTFPPDQFTNEFHPQYVTATTDAEGKPSTANVALRSAAQYCGDKLVEIGEYVANAMVSYDVTDQQSGADIAKSGQV
jgi:hypothetical protein